MAFIAPTRRRAFIDELKRHVPVHAVTEETGEIIDRISGEQALRGVKIPFGDLAIGASALEQNYAVATLEYPSLREDSGPHSKKTLRMLREDDSKITAS